MNKYFYLKTLCDKHDEIYDLASKLRYLDTNKYQTKEEIAEFIDSIATNIIDIAKLAKDDGIRMEERMREYREAIEGLGFKRIAK